MHASVAYNLGFAAAVCVVCAVFVSSSAVSLRERQEAIQASLDPLTDDPAEVEARWEEFDEWIDRREREVTMRVDPALYERLYGGD